MNFYQSEWTIKKHMKEQKEEHLIPEMMIQLSHSTTKRQARFDDLTQSLASGRWRGESYRTSPREFFKGVRAILLGGYMNLLLTPGYKWDEHAQNYLEFVFDYFNERNDMFGEDTVKTIKDGLSQFGEVF